MSIGQVIRKQTALQRSAMFRSMICHTRNTCDSYGAGRFIQDEFYRHLVPTGLSVLPGTLSEKLRLGSQSSQRLHREN